jgi:hypothetical protein
MRDITIEIQHACVIKRMRLHVDSTVNTRDDNNGDFFTFSQQVLLRFLGDVISFMILVTIWNSLYKTTIAK